MGRKTHAEPAALDEYGLPPTIDTAGLCAVIGISSRRLHQLITDDRIPIECRHSEGRWNTARTLTAVFGYYRRKADQSKPQGEKDLENQIAQETLRSSKLKNAKMARELLPRTVYVQIWGELITIFKNRWLNFSHKMGPRAFRAKDKIEAAEILDKEVRDIFAGLMDPKVMESIEAAVRDDEFSHDGGNNGRASTESEPAENLVESNS